MSGDHFGLAARPDEGRASGSGPVGDAVVPRHQPRDPGGTETVERWVVMAQDGHADLVLAETSAPALLASLDPPERARVLYARSLAHFMLGDVEQATAGALQLSGFCRDHGLAAQGLLARALLVELYRREGRLAEAVEELARAVAQEPGLEDVRDRRTQAALGALAVALRMFGIPHEARRVEARLDVVEATLPRHQRVSRWSNLAIEQALEAMAAGRRPPFVPDAGALARAVEASARAAELADGRSYAVVVDEAGVLAGLAEAVSGDAEEGLARLERCRGVLDRGAEAVPARLLWGVGVVRALVRLGRRDEAVTRGRGLLAGIEGSSDAGDRLTLAYEVMRAEHLDAEVPGSGTAVLVELARQRADDDAALVRALFSGRVNHWREADERRSLARHALLDSLTGVLNRRGASRRLDVAAGRAEGEGVALFLLDLDRFRSLNDRLGHLAGDVVLQGVARALRAAVPADAVVARWGGDEFLVVVPADEPAAILLAERLRETVRDAGEPGTGEGVTVSIGLSVRRAQVDVTDWVARAQSALHAARRAGGDGVVVR